MKILVVDDDPSILEAIKTILEDNSYEVTSLTDGKLIDGEIKNNFPDLILLDIWLAGANGDQIAKALKSKTKTKNIPVILISANQDIRKITKESGADDYLAKPFEIGQLLRTVKRNLHSF